MHAEHWKLLIAEGRAAAARLPATSPTKAAASAEWFDRLRDAEPPYGTSAPPLLLHLVRGSDDELSALDAYVGLVSSATPPGHPRQDVLTFGRTHDVAAARQWTAGRVELGVQAHLLRTLGRRRVQISPRLPQGGYADVAIELATRRVWMEISILSDSNGVIDEFDTASSIQSHLGDPYDDAGRVYSKVLSKTWGDGSKQHGQLHPHEPSIIVVGDVAWRAPGFASPGFGWALDQLTIPERRTDRSRASLWLWLEDAFQGRATDALTSLSALSAVAVMGADLALLDVRCNRTAESGHRLEPTEAEALRSLLDIKPA